MGLFEKLGREVEKFKQTAVETAEDEATHACEACDSRFYIDHEACPECGGDVARLETPEPVDEDAAPESDGEDATTEPPDESAAPESADADE